MSEIQASTKPSFVQRLGRHALPIIAIALAAVAFHWQAMNAEELRARERSAVRVQTLSETAGIALRGAMLRKDAVDVMILVEGLVRENHDVLSVRVNGKDGKSIAETEAEHIDEADSLSARVLTQPILLTDASGTPKAIGTLDMKISTKEIQQVASANMDLLMIEGGVCLALCCVMIFLMKKHGSAPSIPPAKSVAHPATAKAPIAKNAAPATPPKPRDVPKKEPRAPQPSKAKASDDGPVEVSLNSPPPSAKT